MTAALSASGLGVVAGDVQLTRSLSIDVIGGHIMVLRGANGSGKTSLLETLAGVRRAAAGRIALDGVDVTNWPIHRRARNGLAWMPQARACFPTLTVRDNVLVAAELGASAHVSDVDGQLDRLALSGIAHRRAGALSGGESRRMELARCFVLRPRVIVLDEPFAGVDSQALSLMIGALRQEASHGVAVLLSDHHTHALRSVADSVVTLVEGTLVGTGLETA